MCETKITDDIRNWMENKACFYETDYGLIKKHYIPWFGKRCEIEPLLNDIEKEYSKIYEENIHLNKIHSNELSKLDLKVSYKITNDGILLSEKDQKRLLDIVFQLKVDNSDLRELLSMYVAFTKAIAKNYTIQNAYPNGMCMKLNETKMRERAMQLGIDDKYI